MNEDVLVVNANKAMASAVILMSAFMSVVCGGMCIAFAVTPVVMFFVPIMLLLWAFMVFLLWASILTLGLKTPMYSISKEGIQHYGITGPSLGLIRWQDITSCSVRESQYGTSGIILLELRDFEKRVDESNCSNFKKHAAKFMAKLNKIFGGSHVNINGKATNCGHNLIKSTIRRDLNLS